MNKEKQEVYMEYQMLMQNLKQLQQNLQQLNKHTNDLSELKFNLESLSNIKVNEETLMPVGSGIFLVGELKDNRKAVMNVGSNVCVEKNIEDVILTVDKQVKEVSTLLIQMQTQFEAGTERLSELQNELKGSEAE